MDFDVILKGSSVAASAYYPQGNNRALIIENGRTVTIQASPYNTIMDFSGNKLDFTSQIITVQR